MQSVPFGSLGFDVSRLGFGTMRLPTLKDKEGVERINREEAIRMLRHAIDGGVSYIDTAYGYHGGESEVLTGLALRDGYRQRVTLTTKLPQWLVKEAPDMDRLLDEQLKRLDLPYVDFYLLHALNGDAFRRLQGLNYKEFLGRALKDGRIRHVGFSFHDQLDEFKAIVDDYPWDMAQIQFNYLDEDYQAGLEGLHYCAERGISIVVMEPLRGGSLARPPQEIAAMIQQNRRGYSPVEWAFRYVCEYAPVVTVLSGMSTMEQVQDNLSIFSRMTTPSLDEQDRAFLDQVKQAYRKRASIGCTACNYCQPCPQGVLIPNIFALSNQATMLDDDSKLHMNYAQLVKKKGDASLCVECGQCEDACPQQLPIIDLLKQVHAKAVRT